jgi:hypothetical protein
MKTNGWFVQWLKGCVRLWKIHRQNRHGRVVPLAVAEQVVRPWPPEGSHPDFGNSSIASPRVRLQDLNMSQIVGDAIFGVAGSKPTKGVKTVVTYEDDTEMVVYEKQGHVRIFLDIARQMDGNDAVVVYHQEPAAEAQPDVGCA